MHKSYRVALLIVKLLAFVIGELNRCRKSGWTSLYIRSSGFAITPYFYCVFFKSKSIKNLGGYFLREWGLKQVSKENFFLVVISLGKVPLPS